MEFAPFVRQRGKSRHRVRLDAAIIADLAGVTAANEG